MIWMSGTKGQMHIQFNWIFVIIVGAVLLGFFFSLTTTQTDISEKRITASTAEQLETIITSTAQKSGTFKEYTKVPQRELRFFCNEKTGLYHYEVDEVRAGTTKHDIVFTPVAFTPGNIHTWTLKWNVPYKVTTFTYLTHDDHAFIFYDDGSYEFRDLYAPLPKNLTHVVLNKSSVSSFSQEKLNYDDYTYVFLKSQVDGERQINDELVEEIKGEESIVKVIEPESSDMFSHGTVHFIDGSKHSLNLNKVGESSPYFRKASLYGALFSESRQIYECTMDKAYQYMRMLSLMRLDRVKSLKSQVGPTCNRLLGGMDDGIPRADDHLRNISTILDEGVDSANKVETLNKHTTALEDVNYKLSMQGSCPLLY